VSPINATPATDQAATIGARVKGAAVQAIPAGRLAGTTVVLGVRQGVQGARQWAAPRVEVAVQGTKDWAGPRLEDAVLGAREWAAPRLEDAADAVDGTVAPKVSSALRSTARQIRPSVPVKTGIRRLLDWRLLLGVGLAAGSAGAGAAIAMRRRYATATAAAKDDSPETGDATQAGDPVMGSEVNGRVTTPGT